MSDELKPCPFCGSPAKAWGDDSDHFSWLLVRIICENTVCGTRGNNYATRAEAIAAWNRRPTATLIGG